MPWRCSSVLADGPATPGKLWRAGSRARRPCSTSSSATGLLTRVQQERGPSAKARTERTVSDRCGDSMSLEVCSAELCPGTQAGRIIADASRKSPAVPVASLRALRPQNANLLRALEKRGFVTIGAQAAPRDVLGPAVERDQPHRAHGEDQAVQLSTKIARKRCARDRAIGSCCTA